MENVENEENVFTPEELAWRLIMDEHIDEKVSLFAFTDDNSKETLFEILITIYIEMLFDYYKLIYLEQNENINNLEDFEDFKLDLNNVNIDMLKDIFSEKLKKIKFILNIYELSIEEYEYIKKNRYCSILLKDSEYDATYFLMNEEYLEPEKRYHFILNSVYNSKNELRDIFATVRIKNKFFKISFTHFS
jgi:uncharacterized protein YrzB (UPF0473 family)